MLSVISRIQCRNGVATDVNKLLYMASDARKRERYARRDATRTIRYVWLMYDAILWGYWGLALEKGESGQ